MIELLITVCLTTGGGCKEVSLLYDAQDVSFMACMLMGQSEIARWQQEHPHYKIEKYQCGIVGLAKNI